MLPPSPTTHLDEMAWQAAVNRGERLWRVVVESARTPGFIPSTMPPGDSHLARGALNEAEASLIADEAQNEPVGAPWPLQDGSNTTDTSPSELTLTARSVVLTPVSGKAWAWDYPSNTWHG